MIYLDYAASTPLSPQVFEAMLPYFKEHFANPSSSHGYGQMARKAIDEARETCINILGADSPKEIIFTNGGTESCNMAIFGAAIANREKGRHIIISAIEHPAVLESAQYLRDNFDFELSEIQPSKEGLIDPEEINNAIRPDTILISVIYANNEIGTVQPIREIAKIAREHEIIFHTDACQAPGYLDINVKNLGVDLMTLNANKIYGPKGAGLLFVKNGVKIAPLIHGGGQEFRMRGGTENTANIVGFAQALELIQTVDKQKIKVLRDKLLDQLLAIKNVALNGSRSMRLENNINIQTPMLGETLVMRLDIEGLAASSGSACSSGKAEPSQTLLALGQSNEQAKNSLRLTLGSPTTEEEIDTAVKILIKILSK